MAATSPPRIFPGIAFQLPDEGMNDQQFYRFCLLNPELRIERTPDKFIVIIPPTNADTGKKNFSFSGELYVWNRLHRLGEGFDSSTGFKLPNGAERSPGAAWIRKDRREALPAAERQKFAPVCPDFVAEIRSPDQSMAASKEKMNEYMLNGALLGWLIDPQKSHHLGIHPRHRTNPCSFDAVILGGSLMPGFEVCLTDIWGI